METSGFQDHRFGSERARKAIDDKLDGVRASERAEEQDAEGHDDREDQECDCGSYHGSSPKFDRWMPPPIWRFTRDATFRSKRTSPLTH